VNEDSLKGTTSEEEAKSRVPGGSIKGRKRITLREIHIRGRDGEGGDKKRIGAFGKDDPRPERGEREAIFSLLEEGFPFPGGKDPEGARRKRETWKGSAAWSEKGVLLPNSFARKTEGEGSMISRKKPSSFKRKLANSELLPYIERGGEVDGSGEPDERRNRMVGKCEAPCPQTSLGGKKSL